MFATEESLQKRKGENAAGRPEYLKLLAEEFRSTKQLSAKEEVLANLANFSYDPINYGFLRELQVINLFLDELAGQELKLIRFAVGGLCNLCLDKENKEYIIACGGIKAIGNCLSSTDIETQLSAITTLLFLVTPQSKPEITHPEIVKKIVEFSKLPNTRISNLANIFLQDLCSAEVETGASPAVDKVTEES